MGESRPSSHHNNQENEKKIILRAGTA